MKTQAQEFNEMLQEEIKSKVENSNKIVEKLQDRNISYRYITSDLGDNVPQILVEEMFLGDGINMTVEFRGINILLTLECFDTSTFEIIQSIKMQNEDAESIANQIEAMIMIYKIAYNEGLE